MAFHDENGRVTIDEEAANADIKKMTDAQEAIQMSVREMKSLIEAAQNCSGATADAIVEKGQMLLGRLTKMNSNLDETAEYIRRVVEIYRRKDEELKNLIESQPG